jgi:hypothetical protein
MEPVFLQIYDVGCTTILQSLNNALRGFGTGAYHTAIEIYDQEWSFAQIIDDNDKIQWGTGVTCCTPRKDPNHLYRETVLLGYTSKSQQEVLALMEKMKKKWRSEKYELLGNNCQSFAASLCKELCVSDIPEWVTSMARAGNSIDNSFVAHALSHARMQSCASVSHVANMQVPHSRKVILC